jgi:hypothetical protein
MFCLSLCIVVSCVEETILVTQRRKRHAVNVPKSYLTLNCFAFKRRRSPREFFTREKSPVLILDETVSSFGFRRQTEVETCLPFLKHEIHDRMLWFDIFRLLSLFFTYFFFFLRSVVKTVRAAVLLDLISEWDVLFRNVLYASFCLWKKLLENPKRTCRSYSLLIDSMISVLTLILSAIEKFSWTFLYGKCMTCFYFETCMCCFWTKIIHASYM